MGNALKKDSKFDNQPDDTSEHDTDLLLDCVSFQCRRKRKLDDGAGGSSPRKQASLLRIRKENEERKRKLREELENKRLQQRAKRQAEEEEAERKCKEEAEAARQREKEKKSTHETPHSGSKCLCKPREKTPEQLAAQEAQRKSKKAAEQLKKEEKERQKLEKEKAKAQKAKEKEEIKAKERAEKGDGTRGFICCAGKTPEQLAAEEIKQKAKEEAKKQKALQKELAKLEKEKARKLSMEQKLAMKAQEKAEREQMAREREEKAKKEKELKEAERLKALEKEKKRLEKEEAKNRLQKENSDLELKWCGKLCAKGKKKTDDKAGDKAADKPVGKEICPPCPAPPVISTQAEGAQTEPVICQAKVDKKDVTTIVSPSFEFEEKATRMRELEKNKVKQFDATTMVSPSLSVVETQEKSKVKTFDAVTMVTPSFSAVETEEKSKAKIIDAVTMVTSSFEEKFKVKTFDVVTMVTPSSSFEGEKEQVDASTLVTPSLSFEEKSIKSQCDVSTLVTPSLSYAQANDRYPDAKQEIEALERALNLKPEPSSKTDTSAPTDLKGPLVYQTAPDIQPAVRVDVSTQIEADDITKTVSAVEKAAPSGAKHVSYIQEKGNQTVPWDFDEDSSEKVMTATGYQESSSGSQASQGGSAMSESTIKSQSRKTSIGTQTECDCSEWRSITEINVREAVVQRTGKHVVKRSIATQTEMCTCNYEESSTSSFSTSEDTLCRQ